MKKLGIIFGLIAVLLVTAGKVNAANGLLWKVSGNGLAQPSYILGTHHLAPAEFIDSIPGLDRVIDEVAAVYGEVSKDELTGAALQQKTMTYAMAPADSTLSKVLTAAQIASLDSLLATYIGMPGMSAQFEPVKPAVISAQLAIMQLTKAFPQFQALQPFDAVILARGESKGKEMGGLETPESQLELLFGDALSVQANDLMEAVANNDELIEQVTELTNQYLKQNLDALTSIVTDPRYGTTPESLERLIYRRNRNWAESLRTIIPQKSVLVVVGCGHLGGDEGLLNLLRKQGYTVTPVNN